MFEQDKKYEKVEQKGLIDKWPLWKQKLREKQEMEKPDFGSIWSSDIEDMLLLLVFLPCMSPKTVFGSSVGHLIQFHKVSVDVFFIPHFFRFCTIYKLQVNTPLEALNKIENFFPYIVASGLTPTNIFRFYLAVESHFIEVRYGFCEWSRIWSVISFSYCRFPLTLMPSKR